MSAHTLQITRIHQSALSVGDADEVAMVEWMELDPDASPPDSIMELAGRACYQSFGRPNPATRRNVDYAAHVLDVEHFSLFAHAQVGYYITGVSRSLTHELIRHRWFSFSQLSQRFVRLDGELPYVVPPLCEGNRDAEALLHAAAWQAVECYDRLVAVLTSAHPEAKPKQIREAARAVLPGMTETRLVVSANLRAWRDLLGQRLDPTADAEIRRLAEALLADLKEYAPASFQDFDA